MSAEQIAQASSALPVGMTAPVRESVSIIGRLLRNPMAIACIAFLVLVVAFGVSAPWLAPFDQNLTRVELTNTPPFTTDYLLGGDAAGRDILSRLMWATRGTLLACVVVLVVSLLVGVTSGLIAGFYGGRFASIANWISDAVMALPGTVLLIALYVVIGPSIVVAMAVFGLLIAPSYFRLVRGVVTAVRKELYVDAARVAGLSDARIIFRHVLGAVRAPIIIQSSFVLGAGIGIQAALEFLGLGNPREASWGSMLQQAFANLYIASSNVIWPAVLISMTILAFVLLGNALRDVLQVTSQQTALSRRQRERLTLSVSPGVPVADQPTTHLLSVRGLRVGYPTSGTTLTEVVRGVDIRVKRGEIHGLVGESGSGKSQTAFAILGILPREAIVVGGSVVFDGGNLLGSAGAMKAARGQRIAYVPQEPMSNLDPTLTIGQQLLQGLRSVRKISRRDAKGELLALLGRVGIKDPASVFRMYPHEISGGMAQRVLITGAIAGNPDLIIADEPTTALDVTVQADVLELLRELRDERGLGMILVTHNLGVVADICDTVSVMRGGEIVESNDVRSLFASPQHPYTKELLSSTLEETAS
jgi:ABC-type dipeptide/oligopeptide/nickel transport system ATPase component/ABC-type dipeptide/oligopeptide/nickel transport system permease subunit